MAYELELEEQEDFTSEGEEEGITAGGWGRVEEQLLLTAPDVGSPICFILFSPCSKPAAGERSLSPGRKPQRQRSDLPQSHSSKQGGGPGTPAS